jgi:hypothetical protein
MKKIGLFLLSIISFLGFLTYVKAESFYEGEYLTEYIKKKNNGVTYYMTMQFIRDSKGDIVYCLEPYTKFAEGKIYNEIQGDLASYSSLPEGTKRKISLIIYYGYGYGNRTETKWYAVTQFMIWKELIPEGDVYFTGSLNGHKVTRYVEEMNEIYNDIENHEKVPSYLGERSIDLGLDMIIPAFEADNIITYSDYDYALENGIRIKNIRKGGKISFTKNSNYYKDKVVIYDSTNSQDLIRPGNVDNPIYNIDIKVQKGNIMLDILKDDSVYSVESDFSDTCYEIINTNGDRVDYVCTADQDMKYNSVDLVYGTYMVRQVSHGIGYLGDSNTYNVTLSKDKQQEQLTLYNYLLKNKIELTKYACKDNKCAYEENAEFEIIDKNNKSVDFVKTDKLGQASLELGYGTYQVNQIKGLENYSFIEPYKEKISDEETKHQRSLFNNYIEKEEIIVKREVPIEEIPIKEVVQLVEEEPIVQEPIEIPYTRTDVKFYWPLIIFGLVIWRKFCN